MKDIRNDLPRTGWSYLGADDLGGAIGHCDLCNAVIRFNYMFTHPDVPEILGIGCECAGEIIKNGGVLAQVKADDKKLKSAAAKSARRHKLIETRWKERNEFFRSRGLRELTLEEFTKLWDANEKRRLEMKAKKGKR